MSTKWPISEHHQSGDPHHLLETDLIVEQLNRRIHLSQYGGDLQAAIDAAATGPVQTVFIDQDCTVGEIIWRRAVGLKGVGNRWPYGRHRIVYDGPEGGDLLTIPHIDDNVHYMPLRNVCLVGAEKAGRLVVYGDRPDVGSEVIGCQFAGCLGNALEVPRVTNWHLRDNRWDDCRGYAVRVNDLALQMSISGGTWDSGWHNPQGFVDLHGDDGQLNYAFRVLVENIQLENNSMSQGPLFRLGDNPALQTMQFRLGFRFISSQTSVAAGSLGQPFMTAGIDPDKLYMTVDNVWHDHAEWTG